MDYFEETYKSRHTYERLKNDCFYSIKITWIIPKHIRSSRRKNKWLRWSLNYRGGSWQAFGEIWLNEQIIKIKSVRRILKSLLLKIPIQGYLYDLREIRSQVKILMAQRRQKHTYISLLWLTWTWQEILLRKNQGIKIK